MKANSFVRLGFGLSLLLIVTAGMLSAASLQGKHEIFWERSPGMEGCLFVWNFDEGVIDEGSLDFAASAEAGQASLPGGVETMPGYELSGQAEVVEEGRFGAGVALGEGDQLQSEEINLRSLLNEGGTINLDLWIRVDSVKALDGKPIVQLPAADSPGGLSVTIDGEGQVSLSLANQVLLPHGRRVKDGRWTHLALVLDSKRNTLDLSLDGHRISSEEASKEIIKSFISTIGDRVAIRSGVGRITVDAVRLVGRPLFFYALEDDSWLDRERARPLKTEPPFFSSFAKSTLSCSFDGTARPESFAGVSFTAEAGEEFFLPGVRGQALDLSRIDSADLVYQGMEIIPEKAGTLEFWFRPKDWDNYIVGDFLGTNVKRTRLFRLVSKQNPQAYMGYRRLDISLGRAAQTSALDLHPVDPGRWTHLLCTWTGSRTTIYLDGVEQRIPLAVWSSTGHPLEAEAYEEWKKRTGGKQDGTFRLIFNQSNTLIDELRVYPWAMNPLEVRNARARYLPEDQRQMVELPLITAEFDYAAHSWDNVEKLVVRTTSLPVNGTTPKMISAVLKDDAGKELDQQTNLPLDEAGKGNLSIVKALPFGSYTLTLTSQDGDGKSLKRIDLPWERVKPVWHGNALGKERIVPEPWTPLIRSEKRIGLWGREVVIGDTGLPQAITTLNRPLLVDPVRLSVKIGGEEIPLSSSTLTFTETADDRVAWKATSQAGPLTVTVSAWMEYDGLIYTTLVLDNPKGVTVEGLSVQFPMNGEETSQLICNGSAFDFRASSAVCMIPAGTGPVWNTRTSAPRMLQGLPQGSFCSQIWLGGDDIGLSFSGENDRGWSVNPEVAAQEILRADGKVIFQMNVISLPTLPGPEHAFHFILTPTPTKPMQPGWRGWNRMDRQSPNGAYDNIDDFIGFPLTANPDKPDSVKFKLEPDSWEAAARQHQALQEKFGTVNPVFLYIDYSWPVMGPSFADWNHDLHAGSGRLAWSIPEVEDYCVWIINEYIRRGLIDGIYVDDVSVGRNFTLAGTAYPWEGNAEKRRQGFSFMGYRRFCQRVWKLFQAQGKPPHILSHMTLCFELPALSFNMSMVNGEARMIGLNSKGDTMDSWSPDELRIMGNGPKWGVSTFWKPTVEVQGTIPEALAARYYRQVRTMHAAVLQTDMWYLWHYPSANVILPGLLAFGMDDPALRFIPYWKNQGMVTIEAKQKEEIRVGFFVKEGRALLLISNSSREDQEVSLAVNLKEILNLEGVAKWRDVDPSLKAPLDETVAPEEIREVKLGDNDGEEAGGLELDDAEEAAAEALGIKVEEGAVRLKVRRRDYRLLELSL